MYSARLNAIPKYVFSSTLKTAEWNNSTIVRGDAVAAVTKLKQQAGRNLLVLGHGLFGEMLLKHHLVDVLDIDSPGPSRSWKAFLSRGPGHKTKTGRN